MEKYVDSLDVTELVERSIENTLKNLDPHSTYISADKAKAENETLIGHFGGIGIRFMILRDTLTVVAVIKDGPSEIVGLEKRDRIIEINNENVASIGLTNQDVLKKLKGELNSIVELKILKPNKSILYKSITRGQIPLNSVAATTMLNKTIGYIKLSKFSSKTDVEVKESLKKLSSLGMVSLILDLRFNGGGYLHQAIKVADEFLKKDRLIVYTKGAHSEKKSFYASEYGHFEDGKLIILVNSMTASASEIVSGAIQDHQRGIIVGRRTFGKGLVQQPIQLNNSSEIRITTSRYYTPKGKCIQKPYGDSIDYDNDIIGRLESGELTLNDSVTNLLNTKGGIIPDIFTPIDTTNYSYLVNKIIYSNKWRDFCFDYYEKHNNKPYNTLNEFYKSFYCDKSVFNPLLNGHIITEKENQDLIWNMKFELSNYYYDEESRYIISTEKDKDILKAISILLNN